MSQFLPEASPQPHESLQQYVRRLRSSRHLSQAQLSQAAGVHRQTIGKIEKGITQRLNQRARSGLAHALAIPVEYLDAVCGGAPVPSTLSNSRSAPAAGFPVTRQIPCGAIFVAIIVSSVVRHC